MTALIDAFGQLFTMLGTVISNFFHGILAILTYIPMSMSMLSYVTGQLPTVFQGFATALIGVSVVYLIIGR